MRPTVSQAIRIGSETARFEHSHASQATWSSKLRVKRESWRAQGTAAAITPWRLHSTLGASASR